MVLKDPEAFPAQDIGPCKIEMLSDQWLQTEKAFRDSVLHGL